MAAELTLQLIFTITAYCSGPGKQLEGKTYTDQADCFKKIWNCGHDRKDVSVSVMVYEHHNCIAKHIKGELK